MQKLFKNVNDESLIFNVHIDGVKSRHEYSFSMLNLIVALILKFKHEIILDILHEQDIEIMAKLSCLVEYFMSDKHCKAEDLLGLIKGINEYTVKFVLYQFGGTLEYKNYLGKQAISFSGHSEHELQVLKEFLMLQLKSKQTTQDWASQEINWVQNWDAICQAWAPSFELGFIVNIPDPLNKSKILPIKEFKNEVSLHIA